MTATAGAIMADVDDPDDVAGAAGAKGPKKSNSGGADVLPRAEVSRKFINGRPSDFEGLKQLSFHLGCAVLAGTLVCRALQLIRGGGGPAGAGWLLLVVGELALGLISSFYFAGFHEAIHGTAFQTRALYRCVSHFLGFIIFRGANW